MEVFRNFRAADIGPEAVPPLFWLLALLSLLPLCVVLPMASPRAGIAIILGWTALLWIAISFARGQFHYFVLAWVAVYPYCYYFLSYPTERSIFTLDRAFIVMLAIQMFVVSRHAAVVPLMREVWISGYLWGLYLLICLLSLAGHPPSEVLPSYRLLVDGMVMPAMFGLYAMRYFPLLRNFQKLHICVCILGIGLCISGLVELTTGVDLFPWNGADPEFTDTHVRRADGPFELPAVLSIVAILAFFLIVYLRQLMPRRISGWRTLLHRTGAIASFAAAVIPLNRGLVFALAPVAIIDSCSKNRLLPRRFWAALFGLILLGAMGARLLYPRLYDDRVARPDNVYQRLAQDRETLRVVREYPLFGVGFNLYHEFTSRDPRYLARWKGIESMNFPHNVLMTVLSEEGIVGLLLYVLAQAFLVRAMWRIREVYPGGWLVFLYCVLIYAINGMDYATVYYSDINLFYIFTLGILLQLQTRIVHESRLAIQNSSDQNTSLQVR
jgi:O-Antigen ligase